MRWLAVFVRLIFETCACLLLLWFYYDHWYAGGAAAINMHVYTRVHRYIDIYRCKSTHMDRHMCAHMCVQTYIYICMHVISAPFTCTHRAWYAYICSHNHEHHHRCRRYSCFQCGLCYYCLPLRLTCNLLIYVAVRAGMLWRTSLRASP